MKIVLARLIILILTVQITVFVMIMVVAQMKHRCMGIGFIQQNMVLLVMEEKMQKGLLQTVLHDRQLLNLKVLLERYLEK